VTAQEKGNKESNKGTAPSALEQTAIKLAQSSLRQDILERSQAVKGRDYELSLLKRFDLF